MSHSPVFSLQNWAPRCAGIAMLLVTLMLSCTTDKVKVGSNAQSADKAANGHQKMLLTLAELRRKINVPQNVYASDAKLSQCDSILSTTRDHNTQLITLVKKAVFFLEYGDEGKAVNLFEQIVKAVGSDKNARKMLLGWLGTAYLRQGERDNCVAGHNADACIMPLQGGGLHQDRNGSRKAAETFEALLKEDPENYDAIWLLNIARMTLGEYPHKVPKQWLLPGLDAKDYPFQPFVSMALDLNVMVNNRAGGSIVDDFDNDGFLDIVTSAWDLGDPMRYYKNNGDGTFTDLSEKSRLKDFTGGLNIQQTDYNNDGWLDIWVLRGAWQGQGGPFGNQPNSLLRNNGDGTFTDVTIEAGLLSFHPTQTAAWADFNNDGWLDLFIGNESIDGQKVMCELYISNQNGTFRNVAKEWGLEITLFVKGVAAGDYNNDGWVDLFLSTMGGQKVLLRNLGFDGNKVSFENVTKVAGFANETYRSFPTWFFDYDNDGWLDIFICNYEFDNPLSHYAAKDIMTGGKDMSGKPYIYRNNGDGTFSNMTTKLMGKGSVTFSMGANFGDFNNDGWLDMYLATGNPSYQSLVPNRLFVNLEGKKFAEATNSARVGNLQKGHGVSISDLDNDGDQDIHVDMGGAYRGDAFPNSLYINPGQSSRNQWIYLKLIGTKSNRAGIGAKITVKFKENGKERMVYRELNSGGSFGSSTFRREIGVGEAAVIDEITIQWPASGVVQTITNVKPNQLLKITEGKENFETLEMKKIGFKRADGTIPMCAPNI